MEVRYFYWEFDWIFFFPKSGRKYSHTNSNDFALTLISLDDHVAAGAWAAYELPVRSKKERQLFNLSKVRNLGVLKVVHRAIGQLELRTAERRATSVKDRSDLGEDWK